MALMMTGGWEGETRTCSDKEFTCSNGRCIPSHWQCDNEKDCTDESDEDPKTCREYFRPSLGFPFVRDGCSIHSTLFLVGRAARSGKLRLNCVTLVCALGWYKSLITGNGTLVYDITEAKKVLLSTTSRFVSWVCCVCAEKRSCELNMFECAPGVCISPAWVCDRQPDCVDARDEFNCSKCCMPDLEIVSLTGDPVGAGGQKVCSPEEFTCRSQLGECVPLTWMCDDNADCSDGSDEKACSKLGLPYSHVACPASLLAH
uniref:Uncharacterized protein n=1 Tax=Timema cristinae TaxID=61476 RepID=A0A7R9CQ52_TIMCR|nr:unnamed protein product [Timema cristinae]